MHKLIAALLLMTTPAAAHDAFPSSRPQGFFGVGHSQFHEFYSGLRNGNGASCCNDNDCRPTQARWNDAAGTYDYMVDGYWRTLTPGQSFVVVTPEALERLGKQRPDGQAHVCTSPDGTHVYCLIPAASGG